MSMNNFTLGLFLGFSLLAGTTTAHAQVNAADSVMNHAKGNKLSIGGYGEAAYSRNFGLCDKSVLILASFSLM